MITRKLLLIIMLFYPFTLSAQTKSNKVNKILIPKSLNELDIIFRDEIGNHVKLVGIGDFATLSLETQTFNTSLCRYLIAYQNFRNIFLMEDEWLLRPVNDYLTKNSPPDSVELNTLMKSSLSGVDLRNQVFRSFLIWLKEYNLSHANDKVKLYGTVSRVTIPPSYFLAKYIFLVDQNTASTLSQKWGEKSYTEQQSLKDIEAWCSNLGGSNLSPKVKQIIEDCREDINHNNCTLIIKSLDEKFTSEDVVNQSRYIAGRILQKTNDKSILLTENRNVIRSNYLSCLTIRQAPLPTVGKLLHEELKSQYYVSVTDFGDTISLPVADMISKNIIMEQFQPDEKIKSLIAKKEMYFTNKDIKSLKEVLPQTIPFIKSRNNTLVYTQGILPFDALFLFRKITQSTITQ